ncbi:hypothetical protein GCM10027190_31530 [Spirosoma areae]
MQQANTQLGQLNQELMRSNANLQQFVFIASHDLQEPLRKIQSFGDLLKAQYADQLGTGVDFVDRMQSAANRMSALIRDLLIYSRLSHQPEANTLVSLAEVLHSVLTDLDLRIQESRAVVEIEAMPTIPGDASQMGQLFQNLVSNALKFCLPGQPPKIRISAERVAASDLPPSVRPTQWVETYHRIDVSDNGIGFEPMYVDRIFALFQRLHGKQVYPGTEIGLAICEKVVTNHGEAIQASSQPGLGATFGAYLPV